jgi:hypothetical protein
MVLISQMDPQVIKIVMFTENNLLTLNQLFQNKM